MYNNQGKSKGMAVVWFTKATDAVTAKAKYDGKFIDGRTSFLFSSFLSLPPHFPLQLDCMLLCIDAGAQVNL